MDVLDGQRWDVAAAGADAGDQETAADRTLPAIMVPIGPLSAIQRPTGCLGCRHGCCGTARPCAEEGHRSFGRHCETNMAPFMPFRVILVIE